MAYARDPAHEVVPERSTWVVRMHGAATSQRSAGHTSEEQLARGRRVCRPFSCPCTSFRSGPCISVHHCRSARGQSAVAYSSPWTPYSCSYSVYSRTTLVYSYSCVSRVSLSVADVKLDCQSPGSTDSGRDSRQRPTVDRQSPTELITVNNTRVQT